MLQLSQDVWARSALECGAHSAAFSSPAEDTEYQKAALLRTAVQSALRRAVS